MLKALSITAPDFNPGIWARDTSRGKRLELITIKGLKCES